MSPGSRLPVDRGSEVERGGRVGGNTHGAARREWRLVVANDNRAATGKHRRRVLVVVQMLRRVTAWLDVEFTHREIRGLVPFADQPANPAASRPFHPDL